jgi:predicted O-methyltransferase YrrM
MVKGPSEFSFAWRVKLVLRFTLLSFHHPGWLVAFARRGRTGLLRRIVSDSLDFVRKRPIPANIQAMCLAQSVSPLSELGAMQDYLYLIVRMTAPKVVVETGVFRGISTTFILAALKDNGAGHLYSLDLPGASYRTDSGAMDESSIGKFTKTGYLVPEELKNRWTLIEGDVRVTLPRILAEAGQIDLFLHDSEHTYEMMTWEFALAYSHLRKGGLLLSDDISWNAAFADFTKSHPFGWSLTLAGRLGIAQLPADPPTDTS